MAYRRMTLSACDWHRRRHTGLRSFFLSVRAVPPYKNSHGQKLQCVVRTGWITPIIFLLGRRRKHGFKKTRVSARLCNTILPLAKEYFHLHLSLPFCVTALTLMHSGQTVLRQCGGKDDASPGGRAWGVAWGRQSILGCPGLQAVGRKGDWQNWWCRHW